MKEIEVKVRSYELTKPEQLGELAIALKKHIVKHGLYTPIGDKKYVNVEGWQFAGGLLGLTPRVKRTENLSTDSEKKWLAEVEVVNLKNDQVVATGMAICSNKESKRKNADEYVILSMAQTRAIGKAYRNVIAWVIKTAGYEGTPAEEMSEIKEKEANETFQEYIQNITDKEKLQKEVQKNLGNVERLKIIEQRQKELEEFEKIIT